MSTETKCPPYVSEEKLQVNVNSTDHDVRKQLKSAQRNSDNAEPTSVVETSFYAEMVGGALSCANFAFAKKSEYWWKGFLEKRVSFQNSGDRYA